MARPSFNSSQVGQKHIRIIKNDGHMFMFQFLIGRLETAFSFSSRFLRSIVSIPHRQARNRRQTHQRNTAGKKVSIPHRQARNAKLLTCWKRSALVSIPHRQARNRWTSGIFVLSPQFQFLIGRLETSIATRRIYVPGVVSIPHRQARNADEEPEGVRTEKGFNSSQVGQKRGVCNPQFADLRGFNSSQVGQKLTGHRRSQKRLYGFQFLIGRLETSAAMQQK